MKTLLSRISVFIAGFFALSACDPQNDSESSLQRESTSQMVLTGDASAVYSNGRFVVWTPKPKSSSGALAGTMMSASNRSTDSTTGPTGSTASSTPRASATDHLNVVAEAAIQEDGTFSLTADVEEPKQVYFYVLDAVTSEGMRLAPVKGQHFILEPGHLTLTMDTSSRFVIEGGKYNDEVFNSWKKSDAYIAAQKDYSRLLKEVEGETEDERRQRVDAASAKFTEILDIETEKRKSISLAHPDTTVRKLTIQTTWLRGPWVREAILRLDEITPEDPWVIEQVAKSNERWEKTQAQNRISIGTPILDFEAQTLDGESIQLSGVQEDSKVILLEFWASWCGPCRTEIPHMKEAYERFKEKGFEIVSFTIDDSREDWELASEEEDLPWLNLGMGQSADAPMKYNVTGVPNNFLFDAETGTIIDKDLRGHHLDVALEKQLLEG